jgi:hypothetical protein
MNIVKIKLFIFVLFLLNGYDAMEPTNMIRITEIDAINRLFNNALFKEAFTHASEKLLV